MKSSLLFIAAGLVLAGCSTPEPVEPVVDVDASMEFLEPGLRPEELLFPEYLLMTEFELSQHGRIPDSRLIGAGLRTRLSLSTVRREYADVLDARGWNTGTMEVGQQSFRLIATFKDQEVEIRAVQGFGPTEIFIMYDPGQEEPEVTVTR